MSLPLSISPSLKYIIFVLKQYNFFRSKSCHWYLHTKKKNWDLIYTYKYCLATRKCQEDVFYSIKVELLKLQVSNEKYNSEISFKLFETIVDLNAFQRKEKKKWNCFFRRGLQFLMHVERFWGHDVWVWLTLTNHDESILFWHLCQRWNQKTILKFQSLTNGGNIFQISYIQEVTSIFNNL